jgi:hypothetical protein
VRFASLNVVVWACAVWAFAIVTGCGRHGGSPAREPGASCTAAAGDPCCPAADGGAPTCGASSLTCAGAACTCLAQVTAVYDTTPVVRRVDGTVWVGADRAHFTEIVGPSGPLRALDVAASGSTAYGTAVGCAIVDTDGGVWCFPLVTPLLDSTDLGAGLGPGVTTSSAVQVVTSDAAPRTPLRGALQLSATMNGGGASFCAVTDVGGIWCWGYGVSGILGRGDGADSTFARPVLASPQVSFAGAAEVRLGFASACARKSDGTVWCWGDDTLGQTGVARGDLTPVGTAGTTKTTPFPAGPLALPDVAERLAANPGDTQCAISRGGLVSCWGWNAYAQAGAAASPSVPPTLVVTAGAGAPLAGVVDLAPDRGMQAMCATTAAGALQCWGHPFPPAGDDDATSPYPVSIPLPASPLRLPLSSFGGRDGALIYVDPSGKLTIGAGSLPFAAQPPCGDATP